jgi:hypothetical protein
VVEIVTEARLFTAVLTRDQSQSVVVRVSARRLTDGRCDVELEQHGGRRYWTFRFTDGPSVKIDGRSSLTEGKLVPGDDELFAQAWAGALGWAAPDPAEPSSGPA